MEIKLDKRIESVMRKVIICLLLLLILTGCKSNDIDDAVRKIAESEHCDEYYYTYEPVANEDDAYIVTLYVDGFRYVTATYIVWCGDTISWELIRID